jgi:hypothetical protein
VVTTASGDKRPSPRQFWESERSGATERRRRKLIRQVASDVKEVLIGVIAESVLKRTLSGIEES